MLETLDSIHWSQVESCYGESDKIPGAIRGLLSKKATVRGQAMKTLEMNLEHQGSVYEASALAVPFLLEILASPHVPDKRNLILLLTYIGSKGAHLGDSFEPLQDRLLRDRLRNDPIKWWETGHSDKSWYDQTYQATRKGIPLYLPLLADPDSTMRMDVSLLLSAFQQDWATIFPAVTARLKEETDEYVQCSLLLCLGHLRIPTPDASQLLFHYLREGETDLLRFIAAIALRTSLQADTPLEVVYRLFLVLVHPSPLRDALHHLPSAWGSGWPHMQALYQLDQLTSSPHRTFILEQLLNALPMLDHLIDQDCADLLLRVAFYEQHFHFQPYMTFNDLDPMQQKVFRTIVATETLWRPRWKMAFQESKLPIPDLPGSQEIRDAFLRIPPTYFAALEAVGFSPMRQSLQAFIASGS